MILNVSFLKFFSMGIVQFCSPKAISGIWLKSFLLGVGRWDVLKIICPQCMEFLVMAHMDFLVVAFKNEQQTLWKLLCTCLKSEWKYSRKYFNNYYGKNCQKILFTVFTSKIINSFPYAMARLIFCDIALAKSITHNMETLFKFLCHELHRGK